MFKINKLLSNEIEFNGVTYLVDLAFDNVLDVIEILNNKELSQLDRMDLALIYLLDKQSFRGLDAMAQQELLMAIVSEFVGQKEVDYIEYDRAGNPLKSSLARQSKPSYSLEHDGEYIYTSFMQAYHMDLMDQLGTLHWKKFQMLLADLPSETKFKQVVEIRDWKPSKNDTAEHIREMKALQRIYALPGQINAEEEED